MFGKNKNATGVGTVEDIRYPAFDFCLRSSKDGFVEYRPIDYRLSPLLQEEEMLPILDDHLKALFSGSVDEGNADMLDTLVLDAALKALPDLNEQRANHGDTIRRMDTRHKADREDFAQIKAQCEEELAVMQADYDRICQMLKLCGEGS